MNKVSGIGMFTYNTVWKYTISHYHRWHQYHVTDLLLFTLLWEHKITNENRKHLPCWCTNFYGSLSICKLL